MSTSSQACLVLDLWETLADLAQTSEGLGADSLQYKKTLASLVCKAQEIYFGDPYSSVWYAIVNRCGSISIQQLTGDNENRTSFGRLSAPVGMFDEVFSPRWWAAASAASDIRLPYDESLSCLCDAIYKSWPWAIENYPPETNRQLI